MQQNPALHDYAFVKARPRGPITDKQFPHNLSSVYKMTVDIISTYKACNDDFQYNQALNPRRVLTKPSEPAGNDKYDNENSDYILYVNDILGSWSKQKYQVLDLLGQGTFGQVVKSINIDTKEIVAIKIVKNKPAYFNQGLVEIQILEMLNHQFDPDNNYHIVRLKDYFVFRNHLCLVFELLSVNLFELIKQNQFRGLSMTLIRCFLLQVLEAMNVLVGANVIHCDLKPENILLENLTSPAIKIIDFGSACLVNQTVYSYIQSRFYRSPEVLIGVKYEAAIDVWSLGCIAAELFLGLPLFPGHSEFNQLFRIIDMLGDLPTKLLDQGTKTSKFFNKMVTAEGVKYVLKSEEQYAQENGVPIQASKKYFKYKALPDIVTNYPFKEGLSQQEIQKEKDSRRAFIHFLSGVLNPDPERRWTPHQARNHPFIKGEPFSGTYIPEPNPTIKQTPPKVIPWGIQGGTLSQKPVSMSYPERGMYESFDNSFSPGSYYGRSFNENMAALGASPYGMSPFSASPYGFGNPNFQLMKQQQLQQQMQQQQLQQQMQQQPMHPMHQIQMQQQLQLQQMQMAQMHQQQPMHPMHQMQMQQQMAAQQMAAQQQQQQHPSSFHLPLHEVQYGNSPHHNRRPRSKSEINSGPNYSHYQQRYPYDVSPRNYDPNAQQYRNFGENGNNRTSERDNHPPQNGYARSFDQRDQSNSKPSKRTFEHQNKPYNNQDRRRNHQQGNSTHYEKPHDSSPRRRSPSGNIGKGQDRYVSMETEANSSDADDIFELEMSSPHQDPYSNQPSFSQPPPDVYGSLSNLHISNQPQYHDHTQNPEPFSPMSAINYSPRGGTYPLPNKRTHEGSRGLNIIPTKKEKEYREKQPKGHT